MNAKPTMRDAIFNAVKLGEHGPHFESHLQFDHSAREEATASRTTALSAVAQTARRERRPYWGGAR